MTHVGAALSETLSRRRGYRHRSERGYERGLEIMDISIESVEETDARLRRVIGRAELNVFEEPYGFEEFPLHDFSDRVKGDALALVHDDEVWSQLVPISGRSAQAFTVFCFHFPAGVDNSGFIGWLATHLKSRFGTGVFVLCGHNSGRGGIFDYWGCPEELRSDVTNELRALVEAGR